jgi:hypothetical protein
MSSLRSRLEELESSLSELEVAGEPANGRPTERKKDVKVETAENQGETE